MSPEEYSGSGGRVLGSNRKGLLVRDSPEALIIILNDVVSLSQTLYSLLRTVSTQEDNMI